MQRSSVRDEKNAKKIIYDAEIFMLVDRCAEIYQKSYTRLKIESCCKLYVRQGRKLCKEGGSEQHKRRDDKLIRVFLGQNRENFEDHKNGSHTK